MQACTIDRIMFSRLLDMLVAKVKDNIWDLFICIPSLDINSGGLKIIESDADVHALYDLAKKYVTVDFFIAHCPQNLAVYYHKKLCLDGYDEKVTSKKREHDKRKKHVGNMSIEELVAWAEEEAKSPYLRSPPLKSRPFRNDTKGKVLFTNTYCAEDEGFEMNPHLNDDEVGMKDLILYASNLENDCVNDAAKILKCMSAGKNDASNYVEYTQGVNEGMNEGINEGMNDGMNEDMDTANNDLDKQVLSRQKKLNKGKSKMTIDDIAISEKRKVANRGNGLSIRENDGDNVVLTDSEIDSGDHAYQNSESDSDHSDKSFDYLSDGEDELIQSKVNGGEEPDEVLFNEGTSAQGQHITVDVERFGEIDDTSVGLTPLIREHEKYTETLLRKLKGNGMGITDPFAIVEESKEKFPIYDDLTH
ncbi:hypothetical protein Tco_0517967 [Tanacetum coccineum]